MVEGANMVFIVVIVFLKSIDTCFNLSETATCNHIQQSLKPQNLQQRDVNKRKVIDINASCVSISNLLDLPK